MVASICINEKTCEIVMFVSHSVISFSPTILSNGTIFLKTAVPGKALRQDGHNSDRWRDSETHLSRQIECQNSKMKLVRSLYRSGIMETRKNLHVDWNGFARSFRQYARLVSVQIVGCSLGG